MIITSNGVALTPTYIVTKICLIHQRWKLRFGANFNYNSSMMKYVNGKWKLENNSNGCVDLPCSITYRYASMSLIRPMWSRFFLVSWAWPRQHAQD